MIGDIIAFDPCHACESHDMCSLCELTLRRDGTLRTDKWISVEERLPEPNTYVLIYVFFHNQWQIVKGWYSYCDEKFHIANSYYPSLTDVPVTHWMPLPEAPKMKGGTADA